MSKMGRAWAVLRIGLGLAQVIGATITLVLLVQTGMTTPTIVATVVTLLFVTLSRLLFAGPDRKD
jgi:hypothetical protein